ncbi:MAG TPA: hypothetical protein VHY58_01400 [Streptosporangiaceae bacterium]|jgi:sugar lactone lactonase YvrE|nr:hypothetical protein [Streptosporangiaceae bacterium]
MVPASSGTYFGQPMTAGHIYTVAGDGSFGLSGNGGLATRAELAGVGGVAVDAAGNLVIADSLNSRVRVVAASSGTFYGQPMTTGHIYTVAGGGQRRASGVPAKRAYLPAPDGLAIDGSGNLVIAEHDGCDVAVVAQSNGTFYGQAMTTGNLYIVAGNGSCSPYGGDGGPALDAAFVPTGLAVDGHGNLIIDDTEDARIRVVAASPGTFYGQPMTAGDIYTVAGDGTDGFSGDGGPGTAAEIDTDSSNFLCGGVAVDAAGNLLIADTFNYRVRVVAASSGTFYEQPMTAGDIYTVAGGGGANGRGDGGPATSAGFANPVFVAVNPAGDLLISDRNDARVRMVTGGPTG